MGKNEIIERIEKCINEDKLEEAVNLYIGHKPEVDEGLSVAMERSAFKAGAFWGIIQGEIIDGVVGKGGQVSVVSEDFEEGDEITIQLRRKL